MQVPYDVIRKRRLQWKSPWYALLYPQSGHSQGPCVGPDQVGTGNAMAPSVCPLVVELHFPVPLPSPPALCFVSSFPNDGCIVTLILF